MVDLSKVKPGDTLKLRCGGKIVVPEDWGLTSAGNYTAGVLSIWSDGGQWVMATDSPFDIIEIIPAPFDWASVEPGMAAYSHVGENGTLVWIVCRIWNNDDDDMGFVVTTDKDMACSGDFMFSFVRAHHLTRAPEHDVKVPE